MTEPSTPTAAAVGLRDEDEREVLKIAQGQWGGSPRNIAQRLNEIENFVSRVMLRQEKLATLPDDVQRMVEERLSTEKRTRAIMPRLGKPSGGWTSVKAFHDDCRAKGTGTSSVTQSINR